jgi:hypothetical protein
MNPAEIPAEDKEVLPLPVSQSSAVYNACKMSFLGLLTSAFESKVREKQPSQIPAKTILKKRK